MKNLKEITPTMGWREWVSFPKLEVQSVKAKIDTGARTSSLHAYNLKYFSRFGHEYVKFTVKPIQKDDSVAIVTSARLVERRKVKDSGGKVTLRPVIITPIRMGKYIWDIELTLINRDEMGFRMLLGRQAVRNRFLINPGKSFLIGKKKNQSG